MFVTIQIHFHLAILYIDEHNKKLGHIIYAIFNLSYRIIS